MNTLSDLAKKYFPEFSDDEIGDLYWNCTPYPAGSKSDWEKCFQEFKEEQLSLLSEIQAYVDKKIDELMSRYAGS